MKPTARFLRFIYNALKQTPPFDRYTYPARLKLIVSDISDMGQYFAPNVIKISRRLTKFDEVVQTLAHEMVHAALEKSGSANHADHDPEFAALAKEVCRNMGWNLKDF